MTSFNLQRLQIQLGDFSTHSDLSCYMEMCMAVQIKMTHEGRNKQTNVHLTNLGQSIVLDFSWAKYVFFSKYVFGFENQW